MLSSILNIGEGSTRTILNLLQDNGLISINKNGVSLTMDGIKNYKSVQMDVVNFNIKDMTIGEYDCIVRVPNMAIRVQYGCEERDFAIKAGASGATTLVVSDNTLIFPGSDYPVDPNIVSIIKKNLDLHENDVIIIGTGDDQNSAEIGAVTAGLELIGGLHIHREMESIISHRSTGNELLALAFAIHDLVGGLPVCAKSRDNLGIRIESGTVIDNAYTGDVLEEVLNAGTTIRKIAVAGPYKGIKVIVTPVELNDQIIAAIGVVDIRTMAGVNNLIRLRSEDQ